MNPFYDCRNKVPNSHSRIRNWTCASEKAFVQPAITKHILHAAQKDGISMQSNADSLTFYCNCLSPSLSLHKCHPL